MLGNVIQIDLVLLIELNPNNTRPSKLNERWPTIQKYKCGPLLSAIFRMEIHYACAMHMNNGRSAVYDIQRSSRDNN